MESQIIVDENQLNESWSRLLEEFWTEQLWHQSKSRFREVIERLSLSVIPVAILPFNPFKNTYVYARYIALPSEDKFEFLRKHKTMILMDSEEFSKNKSTLDFENIPLAAGFFKAICLDTPYMWIKYIEGQEKDPRPLDKDFEKFEKEYLKWKLGECENPKLCAKNAEAEGHFVIPLFWGITPVYLIVVPSNIIGPKHFEIKYIREMLEMIGNTGESVISNGFLKILKKFSEQFTSDNLYLCKEERKRILRVIENRLLGYETDLDGFEMFSSYLEKNTMSDCDLAYNNFKPRRGFSSWMHSLPGHRIYENGTVQRSMTNMLREWDEIRERLIHIEEYDEKFIRDLMKLAYKNKLFVTPHDFEGNPEFFKELEEMLQKHSTFFDILKKHVWFEKIVNFLKESSEELKVEAFMQLKAVLNRTFVIDDISDEGYGYNSIGAGLIYLWPTITGERYGAAIDRDHALRIEEFYKSEVNIGDKDPVAFITGFYTFIKEFNKRDCKINAVSITPSDRGINIVCELTEDFPALLKDILKEKNDMPPADSKHRTSYYLLQIRHFCGENKITPENKKLFIRIGD